jgi:hypothetical protein
VTGTMFKVIEGDDPLCGSIAIEPVVFDEWNYYGRMVSREQARRSYCNMSRRSGRWRRWLYRFFPFF